MDWFGRRSRDPPGSPAAGGGERRATAFATPFARRSLPSRSKSTDRKNGSPSKITKLRVYPTSTTGNSEPLNNRRFTANGLHISESGSRSQHQYTSPKRTPLLDYEEKLEAGMHSTSESEIEMNRYESIDQETESPIPHLNEQVSNLTSQSGISEDKGAQNYSEPSRNYTAPSRHYTEPSIATSVYSGDTSAGTEETSYVSEDHPRGRRSTNMKYRSQSGEEDAVYWPDDGPFFRQRVAWFSITISAIHLGILMIQVILCGLASVDVNPMVGPFPDAFSEWGGKNAYLMLDQRQYYRLITPVFLHVGVLQLLVNVFCQLETCAYFEREWGSCSWLIIYFVSGVGAVASSCVESPDTIGVCSSGAVMGLFGAKIAQVITYSMFDLEHHAYLENVQLDQLGGVLCSSAIVFAMSSVTYIDLSGHVGGLLAGFLLGIFMFCRPIASMCARIVWACVGFGGLLLFASGLFYLLWVETYPDEELADACQYFRNLYPEDYDCDCKWG